jgi:ribosomal protein S27AE
MFPTSGLYIEAESLEMHLGQDPEEDITVSGLIEIQRMLADSEDPFERLVGVLWAAGMLGERLAQLTDHQVGQVMFDVVADQLSILRPETMICNQATRRLFRSEGGKLTTEDIDREKQRPACPKCGNEMLLHHGIDEQDFLECVLAKCGYKESLRR